MLLSDSSALLFPDFSKMEDQGDPVTYLMPVKNKLVREEERGKGLENGATAAVEAHPNIFVAKVYFCLVTFGTSVCMKVNHYFIGWICYSLEQVFFTIETLAIGAYRLFICIILSC
jgi:hypothetical protein